MQEKGFERASRWADRIQLFAFIVVLLIVSAAVWLASYFLIQPFVQDNLVQMLIASSVSLAESHSPPCFPSTPGFGPVEMVPFGEKPFQRLVISRWSR